MHPFNNYPNFYKFMLFRKFLWLLLKKSMNVFNSMCSHCLISATIIAEPTICIMYLSQIKYDKGVHTHNYCIINVFFTNVICHLQKEVALLHYWIFLGIHMIDIYLFYTILCLKLPTLYLHHLPGTHLIIIRHAFNME